MPFQFGGTSIFQVEPSGVVPVLHVTALFVQLGPVGPAAWAVVPTARPFRFVIRALERVLNVVRIEERMEAVAVGDQVILGAAKEHQQLELRVRFLLVGDEIVEQRQFRIGQENRGRKADYPGELIQMSQSET